MKQFKVGIQLYSVRNAMKEDADNTLKAIKEMGYDYVELAGFYDMSAKDFRALLDKYSLTAVSAHVNPSEYFDKGEALIDDLKTVGISYCAIPWYNYNDVKTIDELKKIADDFIKFGEALKKAGIKMLYHNHDFEFDKIEGVRIIDWLYENIPADLMNPEFDTCWVKYAGADPCEYLEKYSGRIEVVHLKDFTCKKLGGGPVYELIGNDDKPSKEDNGFMYKPVGMGMQDFPAILASSEKAGAEYVIVEQDEAPEHDTLEAAKLSRDYLKSLGL